MDTSFVSSKQKAVSKTNKNQPGKNKHTTNKHLLVPVAEVYVQIKKVCPFHGVFFFDS